MSVASVRIDDAVCKIAAMAEHREGGDVAPEGESRDNAVTGAPPGRDPDFHLHSELAEEAEHLATSPSEEIQRLGAELSKGETEATPLIALSVVAIGAGLVVAIVTALVVLAIYLA